MEPHKPILLRAIALEVELMGPLADTKAGTSYHTPRQLLDVAVDFLAPKRADLAAGLDYITKARESIRGLPGTFETVLRLIELNWRIEREWRLV